LAAMVASESPSRVSSLILMASTGLQASRSVALNDVRWSIFSTFAQHAVLRRGMMLEFLSRRSFHDITTRPEGLVEAFHRQLSEPCKLDAWLYCLRSALAPGPGAREQFSAIRNPTLILWGTHDRVLPATM